MKILGIETSSIHFSVCLSEDKNLIYEVSQDREKFSGPGLFNEIARIIKALGDEKLSLIVVSIGPGMFTSLRVGLSLAKGLSFTLNVPIIPVNTLDAMTYTLSKYYPEDYLIVATINAYHNEIYTTIYQGEIKKNKYLLTTPKELFMIIENGYIDKFKNFVIAGSGVSIIKKFGSSFSGRFFYLDEDNFRLRSSMLIPVALLSPKKIHSFSRDALEPFYIKKGPPEGK